MHPLDKKSAVFVVNKTSFVNLNLRSITATSLLLMTPAPLRLLCRVWFGATLAVACLLLGAATRVLHLLPISLESSEDLSVSTAAVLFRLMLRVNPQIRVINTVRHVPGCQTKPSGRWKRRLSLRPAKPTGIDSRPARRR